MTKTQRDLLLKTVAANLIIFYLTPTFSLVFSQYLVNSPDNITTITANGMHTLKLLLLGSLCNILILIVVYRRIFKLHHPLIMAFIPQFLTMLCGLALLVLLASNDGAGLLLGRFFWLAPAFISFATLYLLITGVERPRSNNKD